MRPGSNLLRELIASRMTQERFKKELKKPHQKNQRKQLKVGLLALARAEKEICKGLDKIGFGSKEWEKSAIINMAEVKMFLKELKGV